MKSPARITCIGEAIVDFVATTPGSLQDVGNFFKTPGGAPANVAVGLSRLGSPSAFVGSVGNDPFGRFLVDSLRKEGVDVRGVRVVPRRRTRLAFVALTASGEREFAFWEEHPADEVLRLGPADVRRILQSHIVHVSSFMLLERGARQAVLRLGARLKRRGMLISFDPNLRLSLWKSASEARKLMKAMIALSAIVRMNEEEAFFLTGCRSIDEAGAHIRRQGPALVVITAGEGGCSFSSATGSGSVGGFPVRAVDTTGCGDAFMAAMLHGLANQRGRIGKLPAEILRSLCRFANAAGALTALHPGALAVPSRAEVERFLREQG